jgi:hypothetical protein
MRQAQICAMVFHQVDQAQKIRSDTDGPSLDFFFNLGIEVVN